jgi:hypothetical protein
MTAAARSSTAPGARQSVPGLRFVGLSNPLKGLLLQSNLDARTAARAIASELQPTGRLAVPLSRSGGR